LVSVGFCDAGVVVELLIGGDNVPEADDGGGGMRKGMAPDEDVDGVDAIRTMGNDGV
jgi:hypothetical protein